MIASSQVVAAWVAGWAISRGVAPAKPILGGHYVEVGLPRQKARYVFPSIDGRALRRLASGIDAPWVFLKVCVPSSRLDSVWPPGWVVQPGGFMMTTDLTAKDLAPVTALASGYRLEIQADEIIVASIWDAAGTLAASGRITLADGYATFDQIVTDEAHRRRGLGRVVMAALSRAAVARDIHRAVLVATPAGRALYTSVGWQLHAHFTTAVIPGSDEL